VRSKANGLRLKTVGVGEFACSDTMLWIDRRSSGNAAEGLARNWCCACDFAFGY
jgi:hypothetical protein